MNEYIKLRKLIKEGRKERKKKGGERKIGKEFEGSKDFQHSMSRSELQRVMFLDTVVMVSKRMKSGATDCLSANLPTAR